MKISNRKSIKMQKNKTNETQRSKKLNALNWQELESVIHFLIF